MGLLKNVQKAFSMSPIAYFDFQMRRIHANIRYRSDSRRLSVAKGANSQQYRNSIIFQMEKKYRKFLPAIKQKIDEQDASLPHERGDTIWICWLQGMELAPEIVKICYASVQKYFSDRKIILITEENLFEYITLPDYIVEKHSNGKIPHPIFADIIRLNLLIEYGGTWIDSTILWTSDDIPAYMIDSDLFLPQLLAFDAVTSASRIENYFITACRNHKVLRIIRELFYEYWKHYNVSVDYFLFYDFFELAIKCYPDEWKKMVPFSRANTYMLHDRLNSPYDVNLYRELISRSPFQKLSYRYFPSRKGMTDTQMTIADYILGLPKWEPRDDIGN